jgi:hypothetical protein
MVLRETIRTHLLSLVLYLTLTVEFERQSRGIPVRLARQECLRRASEDT